ncbi:MAG: PEP-CTERM sorting domain-containing protein [Thermoguttaceae bacterium]|jgi:autotransporter-associated beta strand protein
MSKYSKIVFYIVCLLFHSESIRAAVNASVGVDINNVLGAVPNTAIGNNVAVWQNSLANPSLPGVLSSGGNELLRYPGGSYSDIYQWETNTSNQGGYCASTANFANFVRLMNNSGTTGMITVDYGDPSKTQTLSSPNVVGGQPQEAAAWVAYANASAGIYGTSSDVTLGTDAQGTNWYTAGYWAKLRSSTVAQYRQWSQAAGTYNSAFEFLAMGQTAPVGIKYWEIGNEVGGNGYTGTQWEFDAHAPYNNGNTSDNTGRKNNSALSPTAYATNLIQFATLMKEVDPTIKIGAGLDGSNSTANRQILSTAGNYIDFGIVHWYVPNPNSSDADVLNATRTAIASQVQAVNYDFQTYAHKSPGQYEVRFTEFGYFNSVSNPMIDALFSADAYATGIEQGVKSMSWWYTGASTYLNDTVTPGPAYYGIQMYSHLAQAGSNILGSTTTNALASAHATRLSDGSVAIMLVNLNTTTANDDNVTVSIDDANLLTKGVKWIYGATQSTPLQTTLASGLGSNFTITVPYRDIVTLIIPEHLSYTGAGSNTNWVDANGTNWKYGITANGNGDPAVFSSDAHGTFSVNVNSAVTVGKLTADGLGGAAQWNFSGSGNITLQGAGTPIIESDVNTIISAPISGTQGLRKTGNAQLLLSGSLNYSGQTIVDAGTLQINTIGAVSLADVAGAGGLGVGNGANSTTLSAKSISVSVLTIAAGSTMVINPIAGGPLSGSLTAVPEPGTLTLLGITAATILFGYARRRRKA